MRHFIVDTVKNSFRALGFELLKTRQFEELRGQRNTLLADVVANAPARAFDDSIPCEGVIFSFNRPVQLHLLLTSYFDKATNPVPLHVQYGAKGADFEAAYNDVAAEFAPRGVTFHKETSFRADLIRVLKGLKARKMFFLVDDIVFIREVDMAQFAAFNPLEVIPCLRMAPYYTRSYTMNVDQPAPATFADVPGQPDMVSWRWGDAGNEWDHPMSVDGNLFDTMEITAISKAASYVAPNSYEGALMTFADVVRHRPGLCYKEAKIFNNPCNKVQSENDNIAADISPEFLLEKWQAGERLDPAPYYGLTTNAPHQEMPLHFAPRERVRKTG